MIFRGVIAGLMWVTAAWAQESLTPPVPPTDEGKVPAPTQLVDWSWLERYNGTLTRAEFEAKLKYLFDPFGGLQPFLQIGDHDFTFYPDPTRLDGTAFTLAFAPNDAARKTPVRFYRSPREFRAVAKPPGKPLDGLRVAIDPGHIGGIWGQIENRSTPYRGIGRIQEGDCNIITARLLRDRLQKLGATVFLTRETTDPVTPYRPADMLNEARDLLYQTHPNLRDKYGSLPVEEQNRRLGSPLKDASEFLFYRSAEILARGRKIRHEFPPDITITLYINATPSSAYDKLITPNQLIFFVHGAYIKKEAADPRQQFRFFYKLLDNATPIEVEVATAIAESFRKNTGLPPVPYGNSDTSREVSPGYKYVVARNLAANREYDGPVVCTEPYFMNNSVVARRLVAGDYDGEKAILGKNYRSIYREYADNVAQGLLDAYGPPGAPPILTPTPLPTPAALLLPTPPVNPTPQTPTPSPILSSHRI